MCSGRYRTLYICNKGSTTTATAMVAALLLTTPNRGVHVRELADKMDWLKQQVPRLRGYSAWPTGAEPRRPRRQNL